MFPVTNMPRIKVHNKVQIVTRRVIKSILISHVISQGRRYEFWTGLFIYIHVAYSMSF